MDSSILLVVFLLVAGATLASYALSHWSSVRGALGFGWAATSIGTTMLLTAAAIVVLTFVFRGPLWRFDLGSGQRSSDSAAASEKTSRKIAASPFAAIGAENPPDPATSKATRTPAERSTTDASPASIDNKQPAQQAVTPASTRARNSQTVSTFNASDPWAATRCVYVFNRDLSQPVRWKVVNGCDTPVGIVAGGRSLVLPLPGQRPVTLDEQTVDVANYNACFVATAEAIALIGAPSEERSTTAWRQQFDAARAKDACLMQLHNLAY